MESKRKKGRPCGQRLEWWETDDSRNELEHGVKKVLETFKKGHSAAGGGKWPNERVISGLKLMGHKDNHGEKGNSKGWPQCF